jgi:hypothetical protein
MSFEAEPLLNQSSRELKERQRYHESWSVFRGLTLSPIQKFRQFQKFPFKFVTHLLVLSFACGAIITRNIEYSDFIASTTTTLRVILGNPADLRILGLVNYLVSS